MKNLAAAVVKVMKAVKGIDKTMTVGTGNSSYKGVSDQVVKQVIGAEMEKNGLCILPISVTPITKIDRWTETGGQYGDKQKQSVFTEVTTKYLLLHESGESVELSGYGHGIDSQDKGAGKATTYALKYTLLYTFMVATGKIDDADTEHSENIPVPVKKQKPKLTPTHEKWQGAIDALNTGKTTITQIEAVYELTADNRELLISSAL
jgi:hypothetical protein